MNSVLIWNFWTAFFSGRGGMITPLRQHKSNSAGSISAAQGKTA
jgi:hypothetical protein